MVFVEERGFLCVCQGVPFSRISIHQNSPYFNPPSLYPLYVINFFINLLLGCIQLRVIYPFSNANVVYLFPYFLLCFCFSLSPLIGSSMIVEIFLFSSYHRVPIVNLRPTAIIRSNDVHKISVVLFECLKSIVLLALVN
jgi:hypothetical protein